MQFSRFKIFWIFFVCIFGIAFALPNFISSHKLPAFLNHKVSLGLELQGGSYLQLFVDLESAYKEEMQALIPDIKKQLRKDKIVFSEIKNVGDEITIKTEQFDELKKSVAVFNLSVSKDKNKIRLFQGSVKKEERNAKKIDQCIEVVKRRIDESGTKEPSIYKQGKDRIIVQLAGVQNPEDVKKLLGQTGRLTFKLLKELVPVESKHTVSPIYDVVPFKEDSKHLCVLEKEVLLTGDVLENVKVSQGQGLPGVTLEMNTIGGRKFSDITLHNIGKQLAIVIDDMVVSAPKITQHIPIGIASISGSMTIQDATNLKTILSSGSLPAPLKIIEERTVGPSLGTDAIADGKNAVLLSFAFVSVFMFASYSLFGLFACVSLIFNLILTFAALSMLGATLTLPGIAGLALTIGMAVDANVLIYERIKEELRQGLKITRAIVSGFERSMATILDANLTTLIGAAALFEFGSGPVKGFAVTLMIGIVISMFTALTLTYYQIYLYTRNRKLESLPI